MTWLRIFLFLSAFVVDVRVKADMIALPRERAPLLEPENCLVASAVCALKTRPGKKFETRVGDAQIFLGSDTTVIRRGHEQFSLVKGEVWIKTEGQVTLLSEFGRVVIAGGEAWVFHETNRVVLRSLGADVQMHPLGRNEVLGLSPGFENWMGRVGANGKAQVGIPGAMDLKDQIRRWAQLFPGDRKTFKRHLRDVVNTWREAMTWTVDAHRGIVDRQIAAADARRQRQEAARRKRELENARLRELFVDRLNR